MAHLKWIRLIGITIPLLLVTGLDAFCLSPDSVSTDLQIAYEQLQSLINYSNLAMRSRVGEHDASSSSCTSDRIQVRREWGKMSASERIAYTNAVGCLQSKPAKSDPLWAPGAKTRFDDWLATHINQTLTIHFTGTFYAWHRWAVWEYEQSLRRECGYNGTQPYWNWALTAITGLESSPIWDGSPTSMGGNGEKIEQTGQIVLNEFVSLPTGTGGGCVKTGPFANTPVNMGPVLSLQPGNVTLVALNNSMGYNPRCLKRDLTDFINRSWANGTSVLNTILIPQDIDSFQNILQGLLGVDYPSIHTAGHFAMGGDPGRDVFAAPGDPVFWLHHGMVDLVWHLWQTLDYDARTFGSNAISGTGTLRNSPPSPNTTFDTPISLDWAGQNKTVKMRDLMSTISGPFCYVYE
ncbi:Di-copper centre-containing protein [Teratosphaeria destructans]|uniref:Di-copper centre-containing protein n=1 Tax=Teratosphaeria destructans TaxID=418781 RepID=A0A9W7W6F9_9PEZI|nr:Di-copper centre-containing protein [Teratosphaeria destructans]